MEKDLQYKNTKENLVLKNVKNERSDVESNRNISFLPQENHIKKNPLLIERFPFKYNI